MVKLATGATARWIGCAPEVRPRVYFANHSSHLDAVVLWAVLPDDLRKSTHAVAARDYWEATRARRWLARRLFKAVLIDRHAVTAHNDPIQHMLDALGPSDSLIIFPEGTRTPGPEATDFKPGLYHLARRRPDLELVPVYIANLNRMLPKGEFLAIPLLCSVTFGAPLHLEPGEPKQAFLARARAAVNQLRSV